MRKNCERLGFGLKCPVCDKEKQTMVCPQCGFDGSRDYSAYPTFGPVRKVPSVSALRQDRAQKHPGPVPPPPEPPRKKKPWLTVAVCAVTLALGIAIGAGLGGGKPEPAEPVETVQMQKPVETTLPPGTTIPSETTLPIKPSEPHKPWKNNILRNDDIPDSYDGHDNYSVFGSEYQRWQIKSVTFLDTLADMPGDSWDVSESGNGRVMAWVKQNGELYDLYIGAEGGIQAGISCWGLFEWYTNVTEITFGGALHTDNTENMVAMFAVCRSLTKVDLYTIDVSSVKEMASMFVACESLKALDLSSLDTTNMWNAYNMFYNCSSLTDLKLGDRFGTTNLNTSNMFYNCPAGADYQHLLH